MHGTVCIGDAVNWGHSLNRGLVSWWLALPGQQRGNVFRDVCLRNHGALTNGPAWNGAKGRRGGWGSVTLTSASSHYIDITDPAPALLTGYTFIFSVRTTQAGLTELGGRYESGVGATDWYSNSGTITWDDFPPSGGGTNGSRTINDGVWHRIAFVRTATDRHIYVDGTLDATGAGAETYAGAAYTGLRIGRGSNVLYCGGDYADAKFFGRPISASEVFSEYRESLAGYPNTLNWTRQPYYVPQEEGGGSFQPGWATYSNIIIQPWVSA